MLILHTAVLALAHITLMSSGGPADWPGFRGPNGNGVCAAATLPDSLEGENALRWRVDLPRGYSSPIVLDDCIIVTATEGNDLFTICLDRATGETRWKYTSSSPLKEPLRTPNTATSSTPLTDGNCIFVYELTTGLVSLDLDGNVIWEHAMEDPNVPHRMSSSPVLAEDVVVLQCDQDTNSYLLGVDAATGEERWKIERPGVLHGYATPVVYDPGDGGPLEVIVSGSYEVCSYDASTGEQIWFARGAAWQTKSVPVLGDGCVFVHAAMGPMTEYGAPTLPVNFKSLTDEFDADGDGLLQQAEWTHPAIAQLWFLYDLDKDGAFDEGEFKHAERRSSAAASGGFFAIDLGGSGDVTDTHVRWSFADKRSLPDIPSPILVGDIVYLLKEGGVLSAVDAATGELIKRGRVGESDRFYASPIAAGDRLLVASHGGLVTIIQAGREWEPISTLDLGEEIWATPALADDALIMRTQTALYSFCLE
ncbi:MAG: PQQ-binding-like beta-propeller repeat protein [Phycisphaerales bacterium]